ncbi:MAG: hypothetical protein ACLUNZ_08220 [Evtepia sp.]
MRRGTTWRLTWTSTISCATAVHVFSVNEDWLIRDDGPQLHYLYESDGKLSLIPWDYNLALGGMGGGMPGGSGETEESSGASTSVVNSPIDDAFSGTDFFGTLLENETYPAASMRSLTRLAAGQRVHQRRRRRLLRDASAARSTSWWKRTPRPSTPMTSTRRRRKRSTRW